MAYRWRKGRFMTETEYNWDKTTDNDLTWSFIAFLMPIVAFGLLAYYIFQSTGFIIGGCLIGLGFDILFKRLLLKFAELLPTIVGFIVILTVIGIIIYSIYNNGFFSK